MKILVERMDVAAALAKCLKAVEEKSPHTTFRACRIETDGKEQVRFYAGSDSMSVDTLIPAIVEAPGGVTISPNRLSDIITVVPKGKVTLKANKKLEITTSDKRKYTLTPLDCEMKRMEEPPGGAWPMSATDLVAAWNAVAASVATEGGTGSHNVAPAAQLVVSANGFVLGGANGLVLIRVECPGKFKNPGTVLVPRRAFQTLQLLSEDSDKVTLCADQRRMYWENTDTLVASTLIGEMNQDGSRAYPPIEPVVDTFKKSMETAPWCEIEAALLLEALRAVSPVVDKFAHITIRASGTSLHIDAESESGSASEEVVVTPGGEFVLHVSMDIVKNAISSLKSKTLKLYHVNDLNGFVITAENFFAAISTVKERTK